MRYRFVFKNAFSLYFGPPHRQHFLETKHFGNDSKVNTTESAVTSVFILQHGQAYKKMLFVL